MPRMNGFTQKTSGPKMTHGPARKVGPIITNSSKATVRGGAMNSRKS